MLLTPRHIGEAVLVVVLLMLGFEYVKSREDRVRMDAVIQAQKTVIDTAQADRAQHAKEDAARDAATAAQLQSMAQAVQNIRTPAQIVGWSQAQLESAIKGIQITVPAPTAAVPHPEASVTIPESSLPGLRDTIEQCKECAVKLQTAQADAASRAQQMALADTQIQALKLERDTAVKTAKGGTWIHRTGKTLKMATCAALGAAAGGQKNPSGAAIGALGGAIACSLF